MELAARTNVEERFHPPLDIIDPIIHGINTGDHAREQFLQDYWPIHSCAPYFDQLGTLPCTTFCTTIGL